MTATETLLCADVSISELYVEQYPRLLAWMQRKVSNDALAEDLAHDVWVKIVSAGDRYVDTGAPFGAYMFRIAHTTVIDHWRKRKNATGVDWSFDQGEVSLALMPTRVDHRGVAEVVDVLDALEHLTPLQRTVLEFTAREYTPTETSQATGMTADSVKKMRARGVAALQRMLENGIGAPSPKTVKRYSKRGASVYFKNRQEFLDGDHSLLTSRELEIGLATYRDGETPEAIAARLGISAETVKTTRQNAVKRLRKLTAA